MRGLEKLVTGATMQSLDAAAIAAGVPGLILMENAARGAVDVLIHEMGLPEACWVVCGKGNNGGDGLAMARHLRNRGSRAEVLLLGGEAELTGDAAANLRMARACGVPISAAGEAREVADWLGRRPGPSLLVDAILGTGISSAPRGLALAGIEGLLRLEGVPVFAVDLPSGLVADSGVVPGAAARADVTATFGLAKVCHRVQPAAVHCGRVRVVEISIPAASLAAAPAALWAGAPPSAWLPRRERDTHKGSYGRVLLVAGSRGMTGAAALAGRAAVAGGAGLVTVACPESEQPVLASKLDEAMTLPLPQAPDGGLAPEAAELILARATGENTALMVGPGLGAAASTELFVRRILERAPSPLVLDADGLNLAARAPEGAAALLASRPGPTVLTPHPGEMGRLLGRRVSDRLADAREFALASRCVVLLKGAGTIVSDGSWSYVNLTGNPGMATGGAGDVLSGLLAALLGQGMPGLNAAVLGGYLHGLAGDLALEEWTEEETLGAGDLIDAMPLAWRRWRSTE